MSRKIPEDFIQILLSRVDIVEIVSARVKLRKQGANHMGCCPFHAEKTASFSVSQTKQFYYCFGCGASGNAIGFLMNFDKLEFVEAVEELARFSGLEIPRVQELHSPSTPPQKTEKVLEVLQKSAEFYQRQLRTHPAREAAVDYLKNRGVTGLIAQQFSLGYAPEGWSNLLDFLGGTIEKNQLLMEAGLLIQNESGKYYDRFRHRVIFPIRNRKGLVIGFGARSILPEDQPKYLNSPETVVFHKGSELYGLYELRQHRGLPEKILITEGYMDVIALAQFELWFTVATLGTATSKTHVETLLKQSRHLIFCFDGDRAGREAAWRALQVCLPFMTGDYKIEFLFLPPEHDPDSFVRSLGREAFEQALNQASPLSETLLSHLEAEYSLNDIESKAQFVRALMPYLAKLPKGPYQDLLMHAVADKVQMEKGQIAYLLEKEKSLSNPDPVNEKSRIPKRKNQARLNLVEYVISWMIQSPDLLEKIQIPDLSHHSAAADLLSDLLAYFRLHSNRTLGQILAEPRFALHADYLSTLATFQHGVSPDQAFLELEDCLKKISKEREEKQLELLIEKSKAQPLSPEEKQKISEFLRK